MNNYKKFQLATIERAIKCLTDNSGVKRYLVADEVGLGKTRVARGILERLIENRANNKPLVAFYICNSLAVAEQNRKELLAVLPEDERSTAETPCGNRLTLLNHNKPTSRRLHLYSLTPTTSLLKKNQNSGTAEERALIKNLIELRDKDLAKCLNDTLQGRASKWWKTYCNAAKGKINDLPEADRNALAERLTKTASSITKESWAKYPSKCVASLRITLALENINQIEPDIIILDEFQRFSELISPDEHLASRPTANGITKTTDENAPCDLDQAQNEDRSQLIDLLAAQLLIKLRDGGGRTAPALLLLSATPYTLYATESESRNSKSLCPHSEFLDLVQFLHGPAIGKEQREKCKHALDTLRNSLEADPIDITGAQLGKKGALEVLRPVMSRMERPTRNNLDSPIRLKIAPIDLRTFIQLSNAFTTRKKGMNIRYWKSIPYPLQSMNRGYAAWQQAAWKKRPGRQETFISQRDYGNFTPKSIPHPRLRALLDQTPCDFLTLPWLPPSLPWWQLEGAWGSAHEKDWGKHLVFSHYQATPRAIACILSREVEIHAASKRSARKSVNKRNQLMDNLLPEKRSVQTWARSILYFHPLPSLIELIDPLDYCSRNTPTTAKTIITNLSAKLKEHLENKGIKVRRDGLSISPWEIATIFLNKVDYQTITARAHIPQGTITANKIVNYLEKISSQHTGTISFNGLKNFAKYMLGAPGIVIGRVWRRIRKFNCIDRSLAEASWIHLQRYLDNKIFYFSYQRTLPTNPKRPDKLQRLVDMVIAGNLESTLDEHLAYLYRSRGAKDTITELTIALNLQQSALHFQTSQKNHIAISTSAARSFINKGDDPKETSHRSSLRSAFNSPFWPHVLATTSCGQEGLDFHVWSNTIVHWDIHCNPVNMEQREGRIDRYAGLAIRRAIAKKFCTEVDFTKGSPWLQLSMLADEAEEECHTGLSPWWVCDGAQIYCCHLPLPLSNDENLADISRNRRSLYRLVLGMSGQDKLIEKLAKADIKEDVLQALSLDLSPLA